jgi:hypothetical protein
MGSSTKVVPTTSNTQQTVEIPDYLKKAGTAAVDKATTMSQTPFQKYTGELVAPLTTNQNSAVGLAANSGNVGQGAMGVANTALGAAGTTAAAGMGAGQGALAGAGGLFNQQSANATNSTDTGKASGDLAAALASLGGTSATNNQGAGGADLQSARDYNASSAGPITGDMISSYMNPYVQDALNPVLAQLQKTAGMNQANLASKSALGGSFGGSRYGLQSAQISSDALNQVASTTGQGYLDAFNNAQTQSAAELARKQQAAQTALQTASGANTEANDTLSRLTQASGAAGAAGTTQSDLATAAGNRLSTAGSNQIALGDAQSRLSTEDVQRLLSLVAPANQTATTSSQLTNDQLNRLLTTGNLEQTQQQNQDNAGYQQFQNEVNWPKEQLNALLAAAGGVPYGTSSTSNTQGTQVVQSPSMIGQLIGAGAAVAGAMSDRGAKEDFGQVDDEEVLARISRMPVETYRYKKGVRDRIGDDGSLKIGPMAQDFGREFLDNPEAKIIPMPEMMGALISAVRALDKRTANDDHGALAA